MHPLKIEFLHYLQMIRVEIFQCNPLLSSRQPASGHSAGRGPWDSTGSPLLYTAPLQKLMCTTHHILSKYVESLISGPWKVT